MTRGLLNKIFTVDFVSQKIDGEEEEEEERVKNRWWLIGECDSIESNYELYNLVFVRNLFLDKINRFDSVLQPTTTIDTPQTFCLHSPFSILHSLNLPLQLITLTYSLSVYSQ